MHQLYSRTSSSVIHTYLYPAWIITISLHLSFYTLYMFPSDFHSWYKQWIRWYRSCRQLVQHDNWFTVHDCHWVVRPTWQDCSLCQQLNQYVCRASSQSDRMTGKLISKSTTGLTLGFLNNDWPYIFPSVCGQVRGQSLLGGWGRQPAVG